MLICISMHAGTGTLCIRPIILKSKLVVQTIVYLVEGRQMLQEYLLSRYIVFVVSEANLPLATCKVLGYLTKI